MLPALLWLALDWKAEFYGHSVPHNGTSYYSEHHIVVEVEILPDKASPLRLASGDFQLRINGHAEPLGAVTPGTVASAMKYGDGTPPKGLQAQAGPIILGAPRREPRFPGDTRADVPNRVPQTQTADREPVKTDAEAAMDAALTEGPTMGPTKGLIYFPYRGKMKSLKTIELLWGERTIKLR